ncbi:MAG: hypothetical protein EOO27_14030 [Comamonadaceae bacterium]|nr:MAG: hypothetical protein EOO27_14030 [Comamonadaceae bacterium]
MNAETVVQNHVFDPDGRICSCGVFCGVACDNLTYSEHLQIAFSEAGFILSALPVQSDWDVKGWGVEQHDECIYLARLPIDSGRARALGLALLAAANQLDGGA